MGTTLDRAFAEKRLARAVLAASLFAIGCSPSAPEHVLELRADGTLWCDGEEIRAAGEASDLALRNRLAQMAHGMRTAPINPRDPSSPKVPDEALTLRIDRAAPFGNLGRVTEACGHFAVRIWNLPLQPGEHGTWGDALPFRTSKDWGANVCPGPAELQAFALRMLAPEAGTGQCGYGLSYAVSGSDAGSGVQEPTLEGRTPSNLPELRAVLLDLHARWPDRGLEIDAPREFACSRVLTLVNLGSELGFTSIQFANGWIER